MENIERKVKDLLVNSFDMEPDEVTLTANLKGNLGMDHLPLPPICLDTAIGEEFHVRGGILGEVRFLVMKPDKLQAASLVPYGYLKQPFATWIKSLFSPRNDPALDSFR